MSYDIQFDFDRISQQDLLYYDVLDVQDYYDVGTLKDNIHDILRFLNYYDLDLIYLTFLAKKKQVDLAKILELPRDYVYKYIKNLRSKLNEDILQNADNGGYLLKV